jgi:hypothetical protein
MGPTLADAESKRWRVELADKTARTIEARGFRVEGGALVLVLPLGCAAAYAPGTWLTIEAHLDA